MIDYTDMDLTTQGSLEIICGQGTDENASSTVCHIDNFGMLYLPFMFTNFLLVFCITISFFLLRRKTYES